MSTTTQASHDKTRQVGQIRVQRNAPLFHSNLGRHVENQNS